VKKTVSKTFYCTPAVAKQVTGVVLNVHSSRYVIITTSSDLRSCSFHHTVVHLKDSSFGTLKVVGRNSTQWGMKQGRRARKLLICSYITL